MAIEIEALQSELQALPPLDRARLAEWLLDSLQPASDPAVEVAWAQECRNRLRAYERGELTAVDGDPLMQELRGQWT